jgi:FAD/FMN-containing dehydrogenase
MRQQLLSAGFFAGLAVAAAVSNSSEYFESGTPPCDALTAAGLGDRLLFPTDMGYEPQIATWWANNTRLRPWCLVLPHSTEEVSLIMSTLVEAGNGAGDWHIAVKSGGHSLNGGNNIVNGVTIDLSMMNSSHYDGSTNTASLQPGARWVQTYSDLQEEGITVVGGRDGDVGVGGFLLGGGTSFFSYNKGFGCDNVINYEVVLPNGTIVSANEDTNTDLWKALKGGGSNFGIVTRFDVEAIPTRDILYELWITSVNYADTAIDTLIDFSNHDESLGDDSLVVFFGHDTSISEEGTISSIHVNVAGNTESNTSFNNIRSLPALINSTSLQSMAEAAAAHQDEPRLSSNAVSTRFFKNDPEIIRHIIKLQDEFVAALSDAIGAENFVTMMAFQPMPSYVGSIGAQRGGNMLGLDDMQSNAIMWTGGVMVPPNEADFAIARTLMNALSAQIKDFAESVDGSMDLIYLNYADASQDPLKSYGEEQVQFLRDVAAKYDPAGVFQTRFPGGFKISRVV